MVLSEMESVEYALEFFIYFLQFDISVQSSAGGLVWISGWNSLQHATNAAFLSVVYSDYMLSTRTAAVQCSGKYYSPTDIRNFAASQVRYITLPVPPKTYQVGCTV
jgi:hypothetical protein